jgi:hypothetical protein
MNIKEIDKPEIKKVVVVYAGRFQPFHKGHYATYQKLVSKFGANNVYIGTSNDTSGPKSPFDFNEKKTIMNKMFGISPNKIVQVRNPYAPKEILSGMDGKTTAYVAAVGEKDATRLAGKYFKPYKGKAGYGYDEIGYVYPVPAEDNAISGTDVRNWLSKGDDKDKQKGFTKAYPKFDKDIFNMITGKLNEELYKGYPSEKQVKDIERKNKEFRNSPESTSDDEYLYDPIAEILGRVAAEDIFEEFVKSYFKEETEAEKMGLTHLGGGYYGKEGQPASHKSDNGKIRTLTPQEVDAVKKKSMAKGPADAPVNEPKPSQPGQPVNKGATAQGKVDKAKEEPTDKKAGGEKPGEQGPPPEQKLSGAELKSSAEMSDKDKGEQKVKETLDKAKKDLSKEDNESIDKVNNPQSQERKGAIGVLKKAASYIGHGIMHTLEHNKEMMVGTGRAIKSLATTGKMGSIKDKDGNNVHWDRYTEVGEKDFFGNEQPKMKEVPIYKTDSHGHAIKDKDGNKIQDTNLLGKLKTKKEPVYREGLSAEEKELAEKSWKESQRQKNGVKTLAKTTALIMGSIAVTGGLMGGGAAAMKGAGASGILKGAGAKIAAKFGGGHLGSYVMKDIIKHSAAEALGANAIQASGVGIALGAAGIFENKDGEEGFDTKKFVPNFMEKTLEIMQNYKLSDEQLIQTLTQYKREGTKNQSMANASDLMKEDISESKQQSIQHFVEFATKRLKLKETPSITLVGGREFAEVKTSLGGYNPDDKSIYVATEGRLTADILRTLAHEMAHRKQDEMGLVTNAETDGADGSPIENKAHAVAGILMREYGRINKQIYNEDINVDVDKGDTVLMGKFKNKKTTVKDIGTDDHGMPTINGKKATTFRIPRGEEKSNPQSVFNEVGPNDWHFKAIMKMWDTAGSFGRKKIGAVVCNDPKADRNDVARKLRNYGYKEVTHVTDKLGLEEKKNLNELTQGLFAGKVKIGGQPVEIEVELLGADNKTKEFITKIIHIDKKYQSKLPIGSTFKIPARIFRMPGGGWHKIKSSAFNESINEALTGKEKKIKDGNPANVYYAFYKGKFEVVYWVMNPTDLFNIYWDEFKVRRPAGSKFKLNPEFIIVSKKDYDKNTSHYSKLNPYVDKFWDKLKNESINESILTEGGAYGHMSHPFDDMDLTFGDLKKIIKGALTGNLELTREKTDGQALAISWKNGRLIAARNKSHLQNAGAGAMGIEDVASKFGGRGGLTDAYNFAMRDLTAAISGLSEAQRKKIFDEGKCFMNLEVIWPTSVNVIPYGQALLVFHNTTCYDEKGSAVGANQGAATMLAGMIKQVNADVQSKYTIQGPPVTELPKNEELSSKQTKYLTQLQKIQFQFQLSDKDGVSEYHQAWWEDFVNKSKVKLQKLEKEALVRRWAFGDKSFRLNTIADKDAQGWAIENDKVNVAKQQKDNVRQFEEIFLGVGADVLSFMGSVLTVNPDAAVRSMKDRLKSTADKVRGSGDVSKIAKLKMELSRLASIGGKDKIVPNEGIVFVYKGNTYKLTGTFAPLNQILGIFYE